jgi:hypothetical protein
LLYNKKLPEHVSCAEWEAGRGPDGAISKKWSSQSQREGMVDLNIGQVYPPHPPPPTSRITSFLILMLLEYHWVWFGLLVCPAGRAQLWLNAEHLLNV